MNYSYIKCASALHCHRSKWLPFNWDLNIYRGCEHGCKYCYALYSHEYLNDSGFFDTVYIKENVIEQLEKKLRSPSWKRETVNLGGVTDSYQPVEKINGLMPEVLKLLIKYRTPAAISTKSDLILRDFDLLDELARVASANVAFTITTTDEELRQKLEPGAASSSARFTSLKAFQKSGASTGLHIMPIIPFLTDSENNLNNLYIGAKESGADYLLPGLLNLKGKTRPYFYSFLQQNYPQTYSSLKKLHLTEGLYKSYKERIYEQIGLLRQKYGI